MPTPESYYREISSLKAAIYGGWTQPQDGSPAERVPGIVERLDRIDLLVRYGIAAAGAVGAALGSGLTLLVQHFWGVK